MFGVHDVVMDHCVDESSRRGSDEYRAFHREFLSYMCESNRINTNEDSDSELNAFWKSEEYEKCRPWWEFHSGGIPALKNYISANLIRHLGEGGRLTEAVALLSNKMWTEVRIKCGGIAALNEDFGLVEKALYTHSREIGAQEQSRCAIALGGVKGIWEMIAKEWPGISKHPEVFPFPVFWYFTIRNGKGNWMVERYLCSFERFASKPWLKPRPMSLKIPGTMDNVFNITEGVKGVAVKWKAKQIVAASETRLFWIDMKSFGAIRTQEVDSGQRISSIALCEQTDILLLGLSVGGGLQFRNATTGELLDEKGHPERRNSFKRIRSVAISADGQTVVSSSEYGGVRVWDVSKEVDIPLLRRCGKMGIVAISEDGRTVVFNFEDGRVRVWDVESKATIGGPLLEHISRLESVSISADGRRVVSGSKDGNVLVWRAKRGAAVGERLLGYNNQEKGDATGTDGGAMGGPSYENLKVLEVGKEVAGNDVSEVYNRSVTSVVISADGKKVVSGCRNGTVAVWDVESGRTAGDLLLGHKGSVECVVVSADGQTVVSGSKDGTVRLWNVGGENAFEDLLPEHEHDVTCVGMSSDGRGVVSAFSDGMVRVWNMDSGTALGELVLEQKHFAATSAMNAEVQTPDSEDDIMSMSCVQKAKSGTAVDEKMPILASGIVDKVAISADRRRVVACSFNKVCVWDVKSGRALCERAFSGPVGYPESFKLFRVAMCPEGQKVISLIGGEVLVWDLESDTIFHGRMPTEHMEPFVAIGADGRTGASTSSMGIFNFWDLESGTALVRPLHVTDWAGTMEMSANGRTLVFCNRGELEFYSLSDENRWRSSVLPLPHKVRGNNYVVGAVSDLENAHADQSSSSRAILACMMLVKCGRTLAYRPVLFDLMVPSKSLTEINDLRSTSSDYLGGE